MNFMALADGPSAVIVIGGTALATILRCGWRDGATAMHSISQLWRPGFDAEKARSGLAIQVQDIARDGILRAQPHHSGDAEFDEATDAMLERRSVAALLAAHEGHRDRRVAASTRAVRFLSQAADLAPVFGLAGTLVSLSQLPADGVAKGAMTGAISMAVVTTLYGLLLANLALAPLARMVERAAEAEEAGRQELTDWLAGQVEASLAPSLPRPARKLATVGKDAA